MKRFGSLVLSTLASIALVVGTVSAPAFAEEPDPTPIATSTEAPAPGETETPAPEATPTPEATETPAPEETALPTSPTTVDVTGQITRVADEPDGESKTVKLFRIVGQGYLSIDFSGVVVDRPTTTISLRLAVPAGVDVGDDADSQFEALSSYSVATGNPITALEVLTAGATPNIAARVNQTPSFSAIQKIFAIVVTPNDVAGSSADPSQSLANIQADVANADAYWRAQTTNLVGFELAGVSDWYKSDFDCDVAVSGNFYNLLSEAGAVAENELGYLDAFNNHVVLIFPSGSDCGGALGLGTIGMSANSGGGLWTIGTGGNPAVGEDALMERGTLAHELGHNLSLGHANWFDCSGSTVPDFYGFGCNEYPYGDSIDVMGYGIPGSSGGALSSAQAIRASLWPASAYALAPRGTTTYTLSSVSSNTGLRSVVVEDPEGTNYFVEFRNLTGRDAQFATFSDPDNCTPTGGLCVATTAGVRILRLETQDVGLPWTYKGFPGDDSQLVGHTVSGVRKSNYVVGQSFSDDGVVVTVTSMTATTATVTVTRPAAGYVGYDPVDIFCTLCAPGADFYVGDTLTGMLDEWWVADSYGFQWYRNNSAIPGATGQNYTLTPADLGKYIKVGATASSAGIGSITITDPPSECFCLGYGPIALGTVIGGDVAINATTLPFAASLSHWYTTGLTYTYQWLRNGAVIPGGTLATYTPVAADDGTQLSLRVTAKRAGFTDLVVTSAAKNYTLVSAGSLAISGTSQVGQVLSVNTLSYTTVDGASTPTLTYQWLRNGVAIAGATASTYTLAAADLSTLITVRVLARAAGYSSNTALSSATTSILRGDIQGSLAAPIVTVNNATLKLTVGLPGGSVTEPGVGFIYQWYRDGVAVAGATAVTYQLTAADYGKAISARVIVTKLNYNSTALYSAASNYSVTAVGSLTVVGTTQVGLTVSASALSYSTTAGAVSPVLTYQWLRNGVVIAGATSSTYALVAADFGTALSVRVTATEPGFLVHVATSTPAPLSVKGVLSGDLSVPVVTKNPTTLLLTAALPGSSVTDPGIALAYQWLRDGVAIPLATAATFQLTVADYNKAISARVTVSKANYTSAVLTSATANYSVTATGSLTVVGTLQVGLTVSADALAYSTSAGAVTPVLTYVWYRNGVAIVGATASTYPLVAADFGTKLSVRVTATEPGFLAHVVTSPQTATTVVKGVLSGDLSVPVVTKNPTTLLLTAALPGTSVTDPGVALAYQWLRDGVAIVGATAATFQLTAADYNKNISARVTVSKLNYTSVVLTSATANYSVVPSGPVTVDGTAQFGLTVSASTLTYSTSDGSVTPVLAYVWYRNGVAIAGATASTYVVVAADLGTKLSVRITAPSAGFLTFVGTSAQSAIVAKGALSGDLADPEVTKNSGTMVLTAALAPGSVTDSGIAIAYQWFRDGVAIPLATAATFQLTAADYGKNIHVRLTVTKLNYNPVPLLSDPVNYSLVPSLAIPVIEGAAEEGDNVFAQARVFTAGGSIVTPDLVTHQWLRDGIAIAGSTTSDTYPVVVADLTHVLSVRVTATYAGFLSSTSTSASTQKVGAEAFTNYYLPATVTKGSGTTVLTAVPGETEATGATRAYQWFRDGVAIVGATGVNYTATAADYGKAINVRITSSKPTYTTVVAYSAPINYSVTATGSLTVLGTLQVEYSVWPSALTYSTSEGSVTPVLSYVWYRNGVVIPGATVATYATVAADYGTKLSVRVTATEPGFIPSVVTSPQTATTVVKGAFSGDLSVPVVTKNPTTLLLTAALPPTSIFDLGTASAYQWLRDGVAIPLATAATFQLTAADYNKAISVRQTVSKLNFNSAVLTSVPENYSVTASGALAVVGTLQVGLTLSASALAYSTPAGAVTPVLTNAWFRNGVLIAGATGATYALVAADFGTKISVRVTATEPGFLAHVLTSPQTVGTVVKGVLSGDLSVPIVSANPAALLTATLPGTSVTDSGVALGYQWLRDGVAIAGATAATFQLTAADIGKAISARVTVSKLNYTSVVLTSTSANYSVTATGALTVDGTLQVGLTVSPSALTYSTTAGAVSPATAYVWYRNGVVIAGATASTYVLVAADFGAKISVRVTATEPGFIPNVVTSPQTATTVVKGVLTGDWSAPVVTKNPTTLLLTAALPGTSVTDLGTATAYQWLRDGVAIAAATAATFQLTAADYNKNISVRVTVSKLNYISAVFTSSAENYSVVPSALVPVFTGAVAQGLPLTLDARTFTAGGDPVTPVPTYEWLRAGVAIPAATNDSYTLTAADLGKAISVRVTAAESGYLSSISTSAATQMVGVNSLTGWDQPVTVLQGATPSMVLTATPGVTGPAPVVSSFQWLRDGVAIPLATAATFTLTAADYGKAISVRVTSSKATYTTVVTTSAQANYSVTPAGSLTVVGTPQVGLTVWASALGYSTSAGSITPSLITYQWLRNGVVIAGATASTYALVAADFGTALSVRVTASEPGFVSSVVTSTPAPLAVKGVLSGDLSVPTVSKSGSLLLTAALPGASVTDSGVSLARQWLRDGVAIVGATAATFQLTAADYNKNIAVRVTVSKLNYTSVVLTSVPENYSVTASGSLLVSGTARVGLTLSTSSLTYSTSAGPISPALAYQWLRNGVVIAGATASTYALVAADFGTKLSLRVTATESGFLASVVTSPLTAIVVAGVLSGTMAAPTVTSNPVTMKLTAAPTAGSVTDAGIALAYQWYRNGVAISGATAAIYTLTAADYGQEVKARLVVTKLNYTTVTLFTPTVIP